MKPIPDPINSLDGCNVNFGCNGQLYISESLFRVFGSQTASLVAKRVGVRAQASLRDAARFSTFPRRQRRRAIVRRPLGRKSSVLIPLHCIIRDLVLTHTLAVRACYVCDLLRKTKLLNQPIDRAGVWW
jgi:hypothetical protein